MSIKKTSAFKTIIDTDPGIDDAVAIIAALHDPKQDVQLISTVAGNVELEKTSLNALKILEFVGKSVPVVAGASKPIIRPLFTASDIHGHSGLDGYDFPNPTTVLMKGSSTTIMADYLSASTEKLTIIALAPLTNIALLLLVYPKLKSKIDRIIIMGGSSLRGNATPCAEFNFFVDPEAAKTVFDSGVPIVMCGLDVTNKALLLPEDIKKLKTLNKTGAMLVDLFQHYRGGSFVTGIKIHDAVTMGYLSDESMFSINECFVDIETQGEYTAGRSVVDLLGKFKKTSNAKVCVDIDVKRFKDWLFETLSKSV